MNKYKLQPGGVLDQETGAHIPENSDNRDWQKYQAWLEEGNAPDVWMTDEEVLNEARKDTLRRIDDQAEAERQKIITPGAGQAMTYIRKEQEARAALAQSSPAPNEYPILTASIGAELGIALEDVTTDHLLAIAQAVIDRSNAWTLRAAQIEEIRLGAKRRVTEAEEPEEIEMIIQELNWS